MRGCLLFFLVGVNLSFVLGPDATKGNHCKHIVRPISHSYIAIAHRFPQLFIYLKGTLLLAIYLSQHSNPSRSPSRLAAIWTVVPKVSFLVLTYLTPSMSYFATEPF